MNDLDTYEEGELKNGPAYLEAADADPSGKENPFRIEPLAPVKILHRT